MAATLEAIEREAAQKRQAHGTTAPGRNASAKLAEGQPGETRDKVAASVGMGHSKLAKAKAVVAASTDRTATPEVRAVAKEAVAEMDRSGKVDGAIRKVDGECILLPAV